MSNCFERITITDVKNILNVSVEKGSRVSVDKRKYNGLAICTEGEILYNCRGQEYRLTKGNAIILPYMESYSFVGVESGIFPVIDFTCVGQPFDSHVIIPLGNTDPYVREHERMSELLLFGGNRLILISKLYELFHRMSTAHTSMVIAPALEYIEKNYSDPELSNVSLARICGVSEVYFRKLFLKHKGVPPHKFVSDLRVARAKQLLSGGRLKISAVAEVCGFANPYHFCRAFKAHTGQTPTEFMEQSRVRGT